MNLENKLYWRRINNLIEKEAEEKLKKLKDWQSNKKQEVAEFFGGVVNDKR
jgi:hypothetical protein